MLSGQETLEKVSKDARLSVMSDLGSVCSHGEESKFDGGLEYFEEYGEEFDESRSSWQTAFGAAPVEAISPLGYHVTWLTALFLNIGAMVGPGIFTTRMYHFNCILGHVLMMYSCNNPQRSWFCGLEPHFLGNRFPDCGIPIIGIPRISILFSKSIRC